MVRSILYILALCLAAYPLAAEEDDQLNLSYCSKGKYEFQVDFGKGLDWKRVFLLDTETGNVWIYNNGLNYWVQFPPHPPALSFPEVVPIK